MTVTGISVNIFMSLMITLVSFVFTYSLYRKNFTCNENNIPTQISMMVIWGMISLYFILDILQQLIALSTNPVMQMLLYIYSLIPFTFTSLPIVFLITYILSGNKFASVAVSCIFLLFGFLYIYSIISIGQIDFISTSWGSIVSSGNYISNMMYLFSLFIIPTSMILGLLFLFLFRQIPRTKKYKICLSLFSISIVYDFLFLSNISQTGEMMIASRIFIFLGVVLGYLANFPPKVIESRYFPNIPAIE